MDKNSIKKLIMINVSMFPQFYTKMNEVEMDIQINVWHSLFQDQDEEKVASAFRQALKKAQFPVKPADIFAIFEAQNKAVMPTYDELWNTAMDTSRELSKYYNRERGWQNEWGAEKTGYEIATGFWNALPEILKEWKHSPDALLDWYLCITNDNEQFVRREFERNVQERLARRETLGIGFNDTFKPIFDNQTGLLKEMPNVKQLGGQNGTNKSI